MKPRILKLIGIMACLSGNALAETPITDCGTTIFAPGSYKVTSDLLDCPSNLVFPGAITVVSSNVKIDLDDHIVTCAATDGLLDIGILVFSASDVAISGGEVHRCDIGVALSEATRTKISGIVAVNNGRDPLLDLGPGIYSEFGTDNEFSGNIANDNWNMGIMIFRGSNNKLSGNVANENFSPLFGFAPGIAIFESQDNRVTGNTTELNQTSGIAVRGASSGNIVRGNEVRFNGVIGIAVAGDTFASRPIPEDNLVQGNNTVGQVFDFFEGIFDPFTFPFFTAGESCLNTYKGNTFVSQIAPIDCIN